MGPRRFFVRAALCAFTATPLVACQGGGTGPPLLFTGVAGPAIQLSASPSTISFSGVGAAFAQTVTVTTNAAVPAITVDTSPCGAGSAAIVTFAPPAGSGQLFTDVVTPRSPGTCTVTIAAFGGSASVTFVVNSGSVTISSERRSER